MEVHVRHGLPGGAAVELEHGDAGRGEGAAHGAGQLARGADGGGGGIVGQVEQLGRAFLGQHQHVAVGLRHDVHERQRVLVFIDLDARRLAAQDLGEDVLVVVRRVGHGGLRQNRKSSAQDLCGLRCPIKSRAWERKTPPCGRGLCNISGRYVIAA